jgi:hypothetical protein
LIENILSQKDVEHQMLSDKINFVNFFKETTQNS